MFHAKSFEDAGAPPSASDSRIARPPRCRPRTPRPRTARSSSRASGTGRGPSRTPPSARVVVCRTARGCRSSSRTPRRWEGTPSGDRRPPAADPAAAAALVRDLEALRRRRDDAELALREAAARFPGDRENRAGLEKARAGDSARARGGCARRREGRARATGGTSRSSSRALRERTDRPERTTTAAGECGRRLSAKRAAVLGRADARGGRVPRAGGQRAPAGGGRQGTGRFLPERRVRGQVREERGEDSEKHEAARGVRLRLSHERARGELGEGLGMGVTATLRDGVVRRRVPSILPATGGLVVSTNMCVETPNARLTSLLRSCVRFVTNAIRIATPPPRRRPERDAFCGVSRLGRGAPPPRRPSAEITPFVVPSLLEPHGRGLVPRGPRLVRAAAAPEPARGRPCQHASVRGARRRGGADSDPAREPRRRLLRPSVLVEHGVPAATATQAAAAADLSLARSRREGRHRDPQRPRGRRARARVQLVRRILPEPVHAPVAREHQAVVRGDGGSARRPASRKAPPRRGPAIAAAKTPTPVAPSPLRPQPCASPRRSMSSACSCVSATCVTTRCSANARTHSEARTRALEARTRDPSESSREDGPRGTPAKRRRVCRTSTRPPPTRPRWRRCSRHRQTRPVSANKSVVVLPAAAATTRARRGTDPPDARAAANTPGPRAVSASPHWPYASEPQDQAPPAASTATECSTPAATETANVFVIDASVVSDARWRPRPRLGAEAGDAARGGRRRIEPSDGERTFRRRLLLFFAEKHAQLAVGRVPPRPHRAGAVARERVRVSHGDRRHLRLRREPSHRRRRVFHLENISKTEYRAWLAPAPEPPGPVVHPEPAAGADGELRVGVVRAAEDGAPRGGAAGTSRDARVPRLGSPTSRGRCARAHPWDASSARPGRHSAISAAARSRGSSAPRAEATTTASRSASAMVSWGGEDTIACAAECPQVNIFDAWADADLHRSVD